MHTQQHFHRVALHLLESSNYSSCTYSKLLYMYANTSSSYLFCHISNLGQHIFWEILEQWHTLRECLRLVCLPSSNFFPYKSSKYCYQILYSFNTTVHPQTWQSNYFFPALFISGIHKVPGLKF